LKAIILSAGQGSRLLPLTAERPKCLIELSGQTLLDWQLDALIANGITDVAIVTGFRADAVEAHLAVRGESRARIRTVFNPFFQVADNLGSLWVARGEMTGDFLILNGDTLVTPALLAAALAGATGPITVTVDEKPAYDADDMKVQRRGSRLVAIGKTLDTAVVNAESIGLLVFRGEGPAIFSAAVEAMMRTPEGTKNWYLKVIDRLAAAQAIGTVSIRGHEWGEVDFPADVVAARTLTARWAAGPAATRRRA
jgi:choline kinase